MKSMVYFSLAMVVVVNCISVRASDNPAQATARAALVQKLMESEPTQPQPAPRKSTWDTVEPANEPATVKTNIVQPKAVIRQPAPAATVVVAVQPDPVASSAPNKTQPAVLAEPTNETAMANAAQPKASVQKPLSSAMVTVTVQPTSVASPASDKTPTPPKPAATIPAVKKSSPAAPATPGKDIVTIYGTVYKNAEVEKVDADGIIISYSTSGRGMGMTKVYFTDLPDEFRRQYR